MVREQDLKEIIVSNAAYIEEIPEIQRRDNIVLPDEKTRKVVVFYGVRRSGKTYLLYETFKKHPKNSLYIDFEDERLRDFTVNDFNKLREAYFDLHPDLVGKEVYFLLDEIQNVPSWERFVRRVTEREKIRVYVSGSSSKMTPQELHTSLRGRAWAVEVLPFSFKEYLSSQSVQLDSSSYYSGAKHDLKSRLESYLRWGGFPEVCYSSTDLQKQKVLKEYLGAIFFKDVVERFKVSNIVLIDALKDKLFESAALKLSLAAFYKQCKDQFPFSKDSLYSYYKYFIESLIVFEVKKFSPSSYKRLRNPAKIYLIDCGIARRIASEDKGRQLENAVFLELKRRGNEIFYFEEEGECDFIAKNEVGLLHPIQVALELNNSSERRELEGVVEACKRLRLAGGTIVTLNEEREDKVEGIRVRVVPAWKWLLMKDGAA
jgi:uncharacterized protein